MNACQPHSEAHTPTALLHTMLRVGNLERSLGFYVETLGMTLFRREEYLDGRFTGSRSPSSDTAMSSRPP